MSFYYTPCLRTEAKNTTNQKDRIMEDLLIYLSYVRNHESHYNQACVQGFLYGWSLYFLECQENNVYEPTTIDAVVEYAFGIFKLGPRSLYESLFLKLESIKQTLGDAEKFVTVLFAFYENDPVQIYTAFEDDVDVDEMEEYLQSLHPQVQPPSQPPNPQPIKPSYKHLRYNKTKTNHGRRALTPIKRHKSGLRGKTLKHSRHGKEARIQIPVPQQPNS